MLLRRKRRAGIYAEERYKRGLHSWRAKSRRTFALYFGLPTVLAFAIGIADRHMIAFSAGVAAGSFCTLWIALRETPPHYVETWREGTEGERMTEEELEPLEEAGWHVLHDIPSGNGNYDHIVVGPGGVYLLDSKNLQGIVTIKRGTPRLARRHDPEGTKVFRGVRPQALASARRLKEDIEQRTGCRTWVQSIIVFWSEFPQGQVYEGKCAFLEGARLSEWLQRRPSRLNDADVAAIAEAVTSLAREGTANDIASGRQLSPA